MNGINQIEYNSMEIMVDFYLIFPNFWCFLGGGDPISIIPPIEVDWSSRHRISEWRERKFLAGTPLSSRL